MIDADVIIVGAGPTGLMLAGELRLAGVRAVVLERRPQLRETPKASGLGGQVLELLKYRGLLDKAIEACTDPIPAPRFPFGGVHVDLTRLPDPPLHALPLPQARLERLLEERACELGADARREHELIGVDQNDDTVTADVRGPDGPYQLTARYLVGCDGPRSRVRDLAGIGFPGVSYPEVNRLATGTLSDGVTVHGNGDLEVAGVGRIPAGFTRTDRGVFAFGILSAGELSLFTNEDELTEYDDDVPMTVAEFQDSIRRVLGADLPLGEMQRLSRFTFHARQADRYRVGRILLAGDAAHLFPATGIAINAGMMDAVNLAWKLAGAVDGWAPDGLLDTYDAERRLAGERTMQHAQAQVALRRGLDPAAEALRSVVQELLADEQPARRVGAMIAGTDIRYPMPGGDQHPLVGSFAPDLPLLTDQGATSVAELMRIARPVFLDLAGRTELREIAAGWQQRIDIQTAKTEDRPADALLIRPDGVVAWTASTDGSGLRKALTDWFGSTVSS
jgi:2-polyprenyl-6-methoxyphenol hydroxylase-like FAD-dependent oxidoreductase